MEFFFYGFKIGPLMVHYYSLCFLAAFLAGIWFSGVNGRKRGIAAETFWESLFWIFISGIIGARLWHVLLPSASSGLTVGYYFSHPLEILKIWNGGLGIPGGVIGGCIGLLLFCNKYKFQFFRFADSMAPALALGQAIGRWGNYFNQELYGAPSTLPWAIAIDPQFRLPQYVDIATYHPLFLYEMLYNLLNMALLLWVDHRFHKQLRDGDIFFLYLIIYPVGRFFLEFLRLDPAMVGGLNMNQVFMAVVAACSLAILLFRHRKRAVT